MKGRGQIRGAVRVLVLWLLRQVLHRLLRLRLASHRTILGRAGTSRLGA